MLLTALGFVLYALNWLVMRGLFRLRFTGVERLPETGPFLITPNHVSYLDGLAIAAALPWRRLRHLYWAGTYCASSPTPSLACSRGPCICSLSIRDTPARRWKPRLGS